MRFLWFDYCMKKKFKTHQLKDVVEILSGYQPRGGLQDEPDGSYTIVQGKNVSSDVDSFILNITPDSPLVRLHPTGRFENYLLEPQDILFQARGTENKAYFVGEIEPNTLAVATFYILRNKDRKHLLMPWLAWYLNQEPMQQAFRMVASGTSVSYVKRSTLADLEIPIPPFAIQKKIFNAQALWVYEQEQYQQYIQKKHQLIQKVCLDASTFEKASANTTKTVNQRQRKSQV